MRVLHLDARGRLPRGGRPRVTRASRSPTPPGELRAALAHRRASRCASRCGGACSSSSALLTLAFLGALRARRPGRPSRPPTSSRRRPRGRRPDDVVAGATLLGPGDVRDPLPRHDPRRLPHARRGPRRRRARAAAAAARAPGARARTLLLGRWLGAAAVCAPYVIASSRSRAFVLTDALGGWWPDRSSRRCSALALGVAIIAALSLAGSVVLAGDRERDRRVHALRRRADRRPAGPDRARRSAPTRSTTSPTIASWALPFEALYQAGLAELTADTVGFTRLAIDLGPFGGAQSGGAGLWLWSLAYLAAVGAAARCAALRQARPRASEPVAGGSRSCSGAAARLGPRRPVGRRLDAERLGQLARLVHLGDDVAAADQLAADEELRDRRPVRQRGQLLADPRVGQDVDRRERRAERLEGRDGAGGEAAARAPRACPS